MDESRICAVCDQPLEEYVGRRTDEGLWVHRFVNDCVAAAVSAEREACAQQLERRAHWLVDAGPDSVSRALIAVLHEQAAKIRGRG